MARSRKVTQHVEGELEITPAKGRRKMAAKRRRKASTGASGGTATGGTKRRRKGKKAMKGGDAHAIALPKKGAKLAEVVSVLRQVTHRVNQHHTAIKRIEKGCVTAGIIPSATKFTRLGSKKRR